MAAISAILLVSNENSCDGPIQPYCDALDSAIAELQPNNFFIDSYNEIGIKPSQLTSWGYDASNEKLPMLLFYVDKDGGDVLAGKLSNANFKKSKIKSKIKEIAGQPVEAIGNGNTGGWGGSGNGDLWGDGSGFAGLASKKWFWFVLATLVTIVIVFALLKTLT